MKTPFHSPVELLEARIAPAAVFHFIDVDGDKVTIASSKGSNFDLMNAAHIAGGQLQTLDLSGALFGAEFDRADITISAVRAPGGTGDGKVNVGYLKVIGEDLGAVTIDGDLGRIDVGDGNAAAPALASLTVGSIYRFGASTQEGNGGFLSTVNGRFGELKIAGDMLGSMTVLGGADGRIGPLFVGGSLMADARVPGSHGEITAEGSVGTVMVKGSLVGGVFNSGGGGAIIAGGRIGSLTVKGSILGQFTSGGRSGGVMAMGDIGPVKIAHDVQGATFGGGNDGGFIRSENGKIASVFIGGSLIGGNDARGGAIFAKAGIGDVKIVHEVLRGSVVSGAAMGRVSISGSLTGGASQSGLIRSAQAMGPVKIGGDMVGGVFDAGRVDGGSIASVTVHGSVRGGLGINTGVITAATKLGAVKIGHDLIGGSDIFSGGITSGGNLKSVILGGTLYGGSSDSTGRITAGGNLGSVKIGGDMSASYVNDSAAIIAAGNIGSVSIRGSVSTTDETGTQTLDGLSGSIHSEATIGAIVVHGSVRGSWFRPTIFSARDELKSVRIAGNLEYGEILAGYGAGSVNPVNGDAQIGLVKIGGNCVASSIVAGCQNLGTDDAVGGTGVNADTLSFGDAHDSSIGAGAPGIFAQIARIIVRGDVLGTLPGLDITDRFGFVAERIGSVKIGGTPIGIPTSNTPFAIGETADVSIHLIP